MQGNMPDNNSILNNFHQKHNKPEDTNLGEFHPNTSDSKGKTPLMDIVDKTKVGHRVPQGLFFPRVHIYKGLPTEKTCLAGAGGDIYEFDASNAIFTNDDREQYRSIEVIRDNEKEFWKTCIFGHFWSIKVKKTTKSQKKRNLHLTASANIDKRLKTNLHTTGQKEFEDLHQTASGVKSVGRQLSSSINRVQKSQARAQQSSSSACLALAKLELGKSRLGSYVLYGIFKFEIPNFDGFFVPIKRDANWGQLFEVVKQVLCDLQGCERWMDIWLQEGILLLGAKHSLKLTGIVHHLRMGYQSLLMVKLLLLQVEQRKWKVFPSGYEVVEVRRRDEAFGVNLMNRTCDCRLWNLTGVPCVHSVAAYMNQKMNPDLGELQIMKDIDAKKEVMEEAGDIVDTNAESSQMGSRQHKKVSAFNLSTLNIHQFVVMAVCFVLQALLELLDQVEDVICTEDQVSTDSRTSITSFKNKPNNRTHVESDVAVERPGVASIEKVNKEPSNVYCLGFEVSEKQYVGSNASQCSSKVCFRKIIYQIYPRVLYDSVISPGDTVHVIGEFNEEGKCDVNRDNNFLIVDPDILVSGTRVAGSFSCHRRTVLDERLKNNEQSAPALIGPLFHQLFQAGLIMESPTKEFLEEYARVLLQKNYEGLYACGVYKGDIHKTMIESVLKLFNWIFRFRDSQAPRYDGGCIFSQDPAVSYIWSEKTLNDDQRKAILKILTAKDYTLILGMTGTGKTSTMVHAVKAIVNERELILFVLVEWKPCMRKFVGIVLMITDKLTCQGIPAEDIGVLTPYNSQVNLIQQFLSKSVEIHTIDKYQGRDKDCILVSFVRSSNNPENCKSSLLGDWHRISVALTCAKNPGPISPVAKQSQVRKRSFRCTRLIKNQHAKVVGENGMGVSLFCRLSEAHPQAISALQSQSRMCAPIMELSNALIYGDRLRCGSPDVANAKLEYTSSTSLSSWLKKVLDPLRQVIFINTDLLPGLEVKDGKTANNPLEAYIITEITDKLTCQGIREEDIGVITPYNSQVNLIQQFLSKSVEIHTIDKYQGRDKDCILVSFVRSSNNPKNCKSSLLGDWHRINVALTRAKFNKTVSCGLFVSKLTLLYKLSLVTFTNNVNLCGQKAFRSNFSGIINFVRKTYARIARFVATAACDSNTLLDVLLSCFFWWVAMMITRRVYKFYGFHLATPVSWRGNFGWLAVAAMAGVRFSWYTCRPTLFEHDSFATVHSLPDFYSHPPEYGIIHLRLRPSTGLHTTPKLPCTIPEVCIRLLILYLAKNFKGLMTEASCPRTDGKHLRNNFKRPVRLTFAFG
ncbi:DNA replication helicase [Artemisia annua]|uniref:DNA replication ATP-dependent helicase/nuclease n=1 Tax=Artemisia annua TaxID=35608 RepID=A0A2U1QJF0_ARTAN|nr:DNA replication helicase [Artemisia annua]